MEGKKEKQKKTTINFKMYIHIGICKGTRYYYRTYYKTHNLDYQK